MFQIPQSTVSFIDYLRATWLRERRGALVALIAGFGALALVSLWANDWSLVKMVVSDNPASVWEAVKQSIVGELLGLVALVTGVVGAGTGALLLSGNRALLGKMAAANRRVCEQLAAMSGAEALPPKQQMALFYFGGAQGPVECAFTFGDEAFTCENAAGEALECPYEAVYKVFRRKDVLVLRAYGDDEPVDFAANLGTLQGGTQTEFQAFLRAHLTAAPGKPAGKDVWDK